MVKQGWWFSSVLMSLPRAFGAGLSPLGARALARDVEGLGLSVEGIDKSALGWSCLVVAEESEMRELVDRIGGTFIRAACFSRLAGLS